MTEVEGLIPCIYRAIKRKKSRRYYKCLSTGQAYHASDNHGLKFLGTPPPEKIGGFNGGHDAAHRRHRSMEVFPGEFYNSPDKSLGPPRLSKEGVGFRSYRAAFACIGGR
ncbi:hypothetical protein QJS10_CPA16g00039 [Acorus calamus]|uniref:Uncharacterized protein n=1 Tax=Acorus calamus TaxID=4465 RepID=A0AAV9CX91_ACOCL|nr:hypothetical protein QJS10_CPA16g00039 [Acorus calamus]